MKAGNLITASADLIREVDIRLRLFTISLVLSNPVLAAPNVGAGGGGGGDGALDQQLRPAGQTIINTIWNTPLDILIIAAVVGAGAGMWLSPRSGFLGAALGAIVFATLIGPVSSYLIKKKNEATG
jgi:hypothetical protein